MESMVAMLLVGFRFRPNDEELISDYLLKKIKGEELPWDGICEYDLYGEKPHWQICDNQEENVYFFTRLKKLSKNQVARTAGCGVWHENSSANIYGYQGDVIGARKLFNFKVKEGSTMKKSNLIMHEFSLFGEQEENSNWVLCIVQKKGSESTSGVKRRYEDGSQQRKRICCDIVQYDGLQAKCGTPETDLETNIDCCLPACDNSDFEFDLETFMSCLLPEGGDLPLICLETTMSS